MSGTAHTTRQVILASAIIGILLAASPVARAATKTWTNTTTVGLGDFNTAANWSNGIPGSADVALFPATSGLNMNPNLSASVTVNQLEFDQGGYTLASNDTNTTLTVRTITMETRQRSTSASQEP